MRQKLTVDFIVSLDGYGAAEGWTGLWGMDVPEHLEWMGDQDPHAALMGATTYRLMSGFGEPSSWWTTGPSTGGCSCSSTCRQCWMRRPARRPDRAAWP
jgi:hypothetical protein